MPSKKQDADRRRHLQEKLRRPGAYSPEALLALVRECIAQCSDCGLCCSAAPPSAAPLVLGSGPASARLMVVGGPPDSGDAEEGKPFTGAALQLLEETLRCTGLGLPDVYFTKAVKHCARAEGEAPTAGTTDEEIAACRQWLEAEMAVVKPEVVLCLGRRAAQAVLGQSVDPSAGGERVFHPGFVPTVMVTVDPMWVLEQGTEEAATRAKKDFLLDFHRVAEILGEFDPFRGREALAQL